MAWGRKFCVTVACKKCASWATLAACPAWPATDWKSPATCPKNKTSKIKTMFVSNLASTTTLDGSALKIGIVQARFNDDITNALAAACIAELKAMGVADDRITHVQVPGALEVPLALAALAQIEDPEPFSALIALGCIIRGETYHFELVANESGAAVTRVGMDYHVPIANAILTTENLAQAQARQTDKGREAARVAVEMALLLESLA